jgi:hypothetical protein
MTTLRRALSVFAIFLAMGTAACSTSPVGLDCDTEIEGCRHTHGSDN